LKVPESAAGKQVRCPGCQALLPVPAAKAHVQPEKPAPSKPAARGGAADAPRPAKRKRFQSKQAAEEKAARALFTVPRVTIGCIGLAVLLLGGGSVGIYHWLGYYKFRSPSAWVDQLTSSKPADQKRGEEAMPELGRAAVGPLTKALGHEDPQARIRVLHALGKLGPKAQESLGAVAKTLQEDSDTAVRKTAAETLAQIDANAEVALDALLTALKDKDRGVVHTAARLLIVGNDARTLPALRDMLRGGDDEHRAEAATALGNAGSPSPEDVEALAGALANDRNKDVRKAAASALEKCGPSAAPAVSVLIDALKDEDLRDTAAGALGNIGSAAKDALPALRKLRQAFSAIYKARFNQAKEDYMNQEVAVQGENRLKREAYRGTRQGLYAFYEKDDNPRRLEILQKTQKEWEASTRQRLEQQQKAEEAVFDRAIKLIAVD
jgi:hypothetical protein